MSAMDDSAKGLSPRKEPCSDVCLFNCSQKKSKTRHDSSFERSWTMVQIFFWLPFRGYSKSIFVNMEAAKKSWEDMYVTLSECSGPAAVCVCLFVCLFVRKGIQTKHNILFASRSGSLFQLLVDVILYGPLQVQANQDASIFPRDEKLKWLGSLNLEDHVIGVKKARLMSKPPKGQHLVQNAQTAALDEPVAYLQ